MSIFKPARVVPGTYFEQLLTGRLYRCSDSGGGKYALEPHKKGKAKVVGWLRLLFFYAPAASPIRSRR